MKSTHHKLLALGKGLGLAFLLVTGTATMMGVFSSVTPADLPAGTFPSTTAAAPRAVQQPASDAVLYQRVTHRDGSQGWVLVEEAQALAFAPASRDLLMAERPASNSANISRVSYTLQAKPAGWNKLLKHCAQAENGKPPGAAPAYDIACAKLG